MATQKELLEQEEQEILKQLESLTDVTEGRAEPTPEAKATEEQKPAVQPTAPQPTETKSVDFSKYEKEFNELGISLDDEKKSDPNYLLNRFLTVAGMTKKQASDYKQLKQALEEKEAKLASLSAEVEKVKSTPKASPIAEADMEDDEEFSAFEKNIKEKYDVDPGYIEALKVLYNNGKKKQSKLEQQLSQLQNIIAQKETRDTENEFWYSVFEYVPEGRSVLSQNNYAFSAWLEQPLYGEGTVTKGEAYDIAKSKNDSKTVSKLIKQFINETNTPKSKDTIPQNILNQVSPKGIGSSSISTPVGINSDRVFSRIEVEEIWENIINRKYKKEDAEAMEKELERAALEGRIR